MSRNASDAPSRARQDTDAVGTLQALHDLPREIRKGEVARVYLLTGAETYLLDKLLDEVLSALLPETGVLHSMNLQLFDGDVAALDEVTAAASTMAMGADRRVVVLRNPAFLQATRRQSVIDQVRKAATERDAGRLDQAARVLCRALNLSGDSLQPADIRQKVAGIRDRIADDAPECLPLLDDAVDLLRDADLGPPDKDADILEGLLAWARSGAAETAVVVLYAPGSASSRTAALKRVASVGRVADVDSLKEQGRRHRHPVDLFIEKQLDALDRTIRPDAARGLRERTNDDLGRLADELEKLAAFVGERTSIELADVEATVAADGDTSIFDLTDAVGERNLPRALSALDTLIRHGEPPIRIHALLTRQVRLMLQAQALQDAGILTGFSRQTTYRAFMNGVYGKWPEDAIKRLPANPSLNLLKQKPYSTYATLKHAARFSVAELYDAYDMLLASDEALKSGPASDDLILYDAVVSLAGRANDKERHTPAATRT